MAKRFYFDQYSEAGTNAKYTLEFFDEEFSGTAIEIEGSFTLKYEEGRISDLLEGVFPSFAEININVNKDDTAFELFLEEIPGAEDERFLVKIFRNDIQIWTGQVPTDLIQYPDDFYTYTVTMSATCGLARLKDIKYENDGEPYTGRNTLLGHLLNCLAKLNYPALLGFAPILKVSQLKWVENNLLKTNSGIENIDLAYDNFQKYDDYGVIDSDSCYDVIEHICRQFHYRIFMSADTFFAQQVNDNNAGFVYKYALNGTLLSSGNLDYRLYFTDERDTGGSYSNYPAVREMLLIYNYRQGINISSLLPPNILLDTVYNLGALTGGSGESIRIVIKGMLEIINNDYVEWYAKYRISLRIGDKWLSGYQKYDGQTSNSWSDTEAYYICETQAHGYPGKIAYTLSIYTPDIPASGVGYFSLESLGPNIANGPPIPPPGNTAYDTFINVTFVQVFDTDSGASGKIKFTALNTINGVTPIKSRVTEKLSDTIIGDGPRIYSSGRLRVFDGTEWSNSDSWAFESNGPVMNINKLRLQEALALKKNTVKAFDFTLLKFTEFWNYPIMKDVNRLLILSYELDPNLDAVTLSTVFYNTDRTNIIINTELDAPERPSGSSGGGNNSGIAAAQLWKKTGTALNPTTDNDYVEVTVSGSTTAITGFSEFVGVSGEGNSVGVNGTGGLYGVLGQGETGTYGVGSSYGVYGTSEEGVGIYGTSIEDTGIIAYSEDATGLKAEGGALDIETFSAGKVSIKSAGRVSGQDAIADNEFTTKSQVSGMIPASGITSIELAVPAQFTVSGSPLTANGKITINQSQQLANKVLAGPTSGAGQIPAFRSLVTADIPPLPYDKYESFKAGIIANFKDIVGKNGTYTSGTNNRNLLFKAGDGITLSVANNATYEAQEITITADAPAISNEITQVYLSSAYSVIKDAWRVVLTSDTLTDPGTYYATFHVTLSKGSTISGTIGARLVAEDTTIASVEHTSLVGNNQFALSASGYFVIGSGGEATVTMQIYSKDYDCAARNTTPQTGAARATQLTIIKIK